MMTHLPEFSRQYGSRRYALNEVTLKDEAQWPEKANDCNKAREELLKLLYKNTGNVYTLTMKSK